MIAKWHFSTLLSRACLVFEMGSLVSTLTKTIPIINLAPITSMYKMV